MFSRRLLASGFLSITITCLVGCSSKPSQDQTVVRPNESAAPVAATVEPAAPADVGPGTPIGSLKGRNHTVTFYSTPEGPRFTVSTVDGRVLGQQLSVDQLRAQLPQVYEEFKSSIAGLGGYLDARSSLDAAL